MEAKCFLLTAFACLALLLTGCKRKDGAPNPWGVGEQSDATMRLDDIVSGGELIMVCISGPDTYYEYRGRGMGLHYLICERFCQSLGVSLRVDLCKDTLDMVQRLRDGDADIIAMPLTETFDGLAGCGERASGSWHWLVSEENASLRDRLDGWLTEAIIKKAADEEEYRLSPKGVTRRVHAPMQDRARGVISSYDHLFRKYSGVARWDWRLLAAQCYQESTFDPRARSWAGACGLMQIMPATADHLGLPRSAVYDPERNVAAAAKYIAELTRAFSDVQNPTERTKFVLASYNGGAHHIRDAMALAEKHGRSQYRWSDVRAFVLRLSQPEYYNDPVVRYGYMRGDETAGYVDRIWERWQYYRGERATLSPAQELGAPPPSVRQPHPSAGRKEKYRL